LWLLQSNKHRSQPSSAAATVEFADAMDAQLALHQQPDEGHPKTASALIATFETEIVKH
jgi:hypothetical protein